MPNVVVGVDLGGTKIQSAALAGAEIVGQARRSTPREGPDAIVDALVESIAEAAGSETVVAVGIGSPGVIDVPTGTVSRAANVPGFLDPVPVGPLVSQRIGGVPTTVDNDVSVATMGEFHRGAGRPYRDVLGVFLGTGVGGGLVLDGKLRQGRGSAGEIGHMVVKANGRQCACGRMGCLEAYAGRKSIEAAARKKAERTPTMLFEIMAERGRDRLTSGVIARALDGGDEIALKLIDQAVWAMAIALASAHNLVDFEAVVIGGGLGDRLGRPFVDRIDQQMRPRIFSTPPRLLTTELGDLSGAVGAAILAGAPA